MIGCFGPFGTININNAEDIYIYIHRIEYVTGISYIHIYIHTYIHTYILTYIYIYVYIITREYEYS